MHDVERGSEAALELASEIGGVIRLCLLEPDVLFCLEYLSVPLVLYTYVAGAGALHLGGAWAYRERNIYCANPIEIS